MLHDLAETRRVLETQGIDVVRLIFTDLLGITRSKDLLVSQLERSAAHGPAFCQGTWVTTTRGGVLDAGTGSFGDGLPDMVASLDTDTIRPIPWLPGVAYAIADIDNPDGSGSDVAPRAVLRSVLDEYDKLASSRSAAPSWSSTSPNEGRLERSQQDRSRVHDRGARGPRRPLLAPAADARPAQHRRLRGQPRVLPVAVRDQPVAQRGDGCRRPDVPVQDGHQGRHRDAWDPRHVPRQAVERRGRQRLHLLRTRTIVRATAPCREWPAR
jgi:hypothetical protein